MNKKILIAEDNQAVGETFVSILEKRGNQVTWAKDGTEALDIYCKENLIATHDGKKPFDVVIMDFGMPKMTGTDVVKGILMLQQTQRIVFCTAYGRDLIRETPEFEKGIEILEKPVSLAQLLNVVEGNYTQTVREKESQQELDGTEMAPNAGIT